MLDKPRTFVYEKVKFKCVKRKRYKNIDLRIQIGSTDDSPNITFFFLNISCEKIIQANIKQA